MEDFGVDLIYSLGYQRRLAASGKPLFHFGIYTLDPDRRELRRGRETIALEPQVFDLLEYLLRHRARVVSKDELIASIWDGRIVSESALAVRINAVRKAIGDSGAEQRFIKTLPRKGIRFVGVAHEGPASDDSSAVTSAGLHQPLPARNASLTAERRQLTVLSCELVPGPSATIADPEDLREMIGAYHRRVEGIVKRWNGLVGGRLGKSVLAYFGHPAAHEDDAEQAVQAGLALCKGAEGQSHERARSPVRIGIATGQVVIGEISSGQLTENEPIGEVIGVASQLQQAASPGGILVDASTRELIGSLFDCRPIQQVGGSEASETISAWEILEARAVPSRFEALRPAALTPLIGRGEELELLLRRWSQAKSGEGRVVLISGEPGIGKSRLIVALQEALQIDSLIPLRYFCSPQHTDSAFYSVIGQLERAAGILRADSPTDRLDKLDRLLARTNTTKEDAGLLAEMLSLPNDGRYPALDLLPDQRRQRTLRALTSQVEALVRQAPVLILVEDAHWMDPTSLETFSILVNRISALRALLVVSFRPEFDAPWAGRSHVTTLTLSRLGRQDVGAMIDGLAGDRPIPANVRQQIIERADGIPLFIEEMTKGMMEAEPEGAAPQNAAASRPHADAVPSTLQAHLLARLDRLGTAKEVAQVGATIGREFSHVLLAAVIRKPEAELCAALDRLVAAGLLFRQGVMPNSMYLFKHALLRDAAYGTLLRGQRRALHAKIAEKLMSQFTEIADTQPELLARHSSEAGLVDQAAILWGKAGLRSLERSALVEAVEQLRRALDQIGVLPATALWRRAEIRWQVALANALMHVKGYAAPESRAAEERARRLIEESEALGEGLEDPMLLYSVLYGFWAASYVAFDGAAMRRLAEQFLAAAERQDAAGPRMVGHRVMGFSLMLTGDLAAARRHFDRGLSLHDRAEHRGLSTRFGVDVGISLLSYRSITLWMLGDPAAALRDAEQALVEARVINHAATLLFALLHTALTHLLCGAYAGASAEAGELVILAEEKGASFWKALGMLMQGCHLVLNGDAAEAYRLLTEGIVALRSTGATLWAPLHLSFLARAQAALGRLDEAWSSIREALHAVESAGETWWAPEVYRVAGEIALLSPATDVKKAEECFELALRTARAQQASSWELRSSISMARFWSQRGKLNEARDLLARARERLSGDDSLDQVEARVLIEALNTDIMS